MLRKIFLTICGTLKTNNNGDKKQPWGGLLFLKKLFTDRHLYALKKGIVFLLCSRSNTKVRKIGKTCYWFPGSKRLLLFASSGMIGEFLSQREAEIHVSAIS